MTKTDIALKADVIGELVWDPAVKETAIGVAVKDGVVTLTGHLDTYAEKDAAMRAVRRVGGVKAIAVEIDVKLSPTHQRSDTENHPSGRRNAHGNLGGTMRKERARHPGDRKNPPFQRNRRISGSGMPGGAASPPISFGTPLAF